MHWIVTNVPSCSSVPVILDCIMAYPGVRPVIPQMLISKAVYYFTALSQMLQFSLVKKAEKVPSIFPPILNIKMLTMMA